MKIAKKNWLANLGVMALSLLAALLIGEGICRILLPDSPPGTTYGKRIERNKFGFREKEIVMPKLEGQYRIFFLGDSFTWGVGLDPDETLPKLIEKSLRRNHPEVEIINGAIPGDNTVQQLSRLKRFGLKYQPDAVVLVYNPNDVEHQEEYKVRTHQKPAVNLVTILKQHSRLLALSASQIGSLKRKMHGRRSSMAAWYEQLFERCVKDHEGWIASKTALREIADLCRQENIRFVVVIYPFMIELEDYKGKAAHQKIKATAEALGVPALDLLPFFEGRSGEEFWITYSDNHPNRKAHEIAVSAAAPFIEKELFANA
jgi:lysophospholipase L1-like esterase